MMNLVQIIHPHALYTQLPMNMHLASGEKGLLFPRSLWRMADGGQFPRLYREIRSKLSRCTLSLPVSIFSLYFLGVDTARVVQYVYSYIYIYYAHTHGVSKYIIYTVHIQIKIDI